MKKKSVRCSIILGILFMAVSAHASIIQDTNAGWWLQIQYAQPIAQSFTAVDSHSSWAGMYVGDGNQGYNDFTLTMKLFSGDGIFTSDHLLLSRDVDISSIGSQGYADLDVSSILFDIGSSYTIALYNDTPRWGALLINSNLYDGGMLYSGFGPIPNGEARFHVLAEPVPEPSTFALIGIGLVGIGLMRRKYGTK